MDTLMNSIAKKFEKGQEFSASERYLVIVPVDQLSTKANLGYPRVLQVSIPPPLRKCHPHP